MIKSTISRSLDYLANKINERSYNLRVAMYRQASEETLSYIKEMCHNGLFLAEGNLEQITHALDKVTIDGAYLELGVRDGYSINHIAKQISDINKSIHGFDSFEGLPEDFVDHPKGKFLVDKLPTVEPNVILHKGLFKDTLPEFKFSETIAFMNIDCQIYKSAKDVFDNFETNIAKGTIIRMNSYWNFPFWKEYEHKAFQEYVKKFEIKYKYLSSDGAGGVVVIIE